MGAAGERERTPLISRRGIVVLARPRPSSYFCAKLQLLCACVSCRVRGTIFLFPAAMLPSWPSAPTGSWRLTDKDLQARIPLELGFPRKLIVRGTRHHPESGM